MKTYAPEINDVDSYIAGFPEPVQKLLQQMRAVIIKAAPAAQECISYRMPAYRDHGVLVYFAGYKTHIGFYPTASGIARFEKELASYESSKGAVRFPLNKALPVKLIAKMVQFRLNENLQKSSILKK